MYNEYVNPHVGGKLILGILLVSFHRLRRWVADREVAVEKRPTSYFDCCPRLPESHRSASFPFRLFADADSQFDIGPKTVIFDHPRYDVRRSYLD